MAMRIRRTASEDLAGMGRQTYTQLEVDKEGLRRLVSLLISGKVKRSWKARAGGRVGIWAARGGLSVKRLHSRLTLGDVGRYSWPLTIQLSGAYEGPGVTEFSEQCQAVASFFVSEYRKCGGTADIEELGRQLRDVFKTQVAELAVGIFDDETIQLMRIGVYDRTLMKIAMILVGEAREAVGTLGD